MIDHPVYVNFKYITELDPSENPQKNNAEEDQLYQLPFVHREFQIYRQHDCVQKYEEHQSCHNRTPEFLRDKWKIPERHGNPGKEAGRKQVGS